MTCCGSPLIGSNVAIGHTPARCTNSGTFLVRRSGSDANAYTLSIRCVPALFLSLAKFSQGQR